MKKGTLSVLLLSLALVLSACGGKGGAEGYQTQAVQDLIDGGAFSEELEELDGDTAFALYGLGDAGLKRENLTDCSVYRSAGATCEEGAVLVFQSEEQAKLAVQALGDYISAQIESNRDYRPAELPKLEAAQVDQRGASVLLVVAADAQAAKDALKQ